jgi:hypothetical protein
MRRISFVLIGLLLASIQLHAFAQTVRPESTNYEVQSDVQPVGGGDKAKSTLYQLDDTIGEPNIGESRSNLYNLGAGYRYTEGEPYISLNCDDTADLGFISFNGRQTQPINCTVITDSDTGYALAWDITTGSGGTYTGYLINEFENTIAPFHPSVAGTPDTWTVANNDARWGGRLSSTSTDTDVKWGTDLSTDKWLNVGTGSYTVVSRSSRTDLAGSTETLQFRAEIGAQKIQPTGTYQANVTLTASAL